MRTRPIHALIGLVLMTILLAASAWAKTIPELEWTIEPGKHSTELIPHGNEFQKIKIELTSDIPVDIYVVDYDDLPAFISSGYNSTYENKYEGRTDFELLYEYPDQTERYLVVVNPSLTDTANVVVENNLVIEGLDDDDTDDNKLCGSYLAAGIVGLLFITIVLVLIKKR